MIYCLAVLTSRGNRVRGLILPCLLNLIGALILDVGLTLLVLPILNCYFFYYISLGLIRTEFVNFASSSKSCAGLELKEVVFL